MNRKRMPKQSEYTKAVLKLLDDYAKETGDNSGDLMRAAHWLHAHGLMDPPEYDPVKLIAKRLATACRQDYIADENGEPVRHRHAYVPEGDAAQRTFEWFKIEDATPEKMRLSAQGRRNGTLLDLLQLVRDVNYYNKHFNPGDPIAVEANFTPDIAELSMPREYPDAPDDDEDGEDDAGQPVA